MVKRIILRKREFAGQCTVRYVCDICDGLWFSKKTAVNCEYRHRLKRNYFGWMDDE